MHAASQTTRRTWRGCRRHLRVLPCICQGATVSRSTRWVCILHMKIICRAQALHHSPHVQCVVGTDSRHLDHIITGVLRAGLGLRSSFRLHSFQIKGKPVETELFKREWKSSEDKLLKKVGASAA